MIDVEILKLGMSNGTGLAQTWRAKGRAGLNQKELAQPGLCF